MNLIIINYLQECRGVVMIVQATCKQFLNIITCIHLQLSTTVTCSIIATDQPTICPKNYACITVMFLLWILHSVQEESHEQVVKKLYVYVIEFLDTNNCNHHEEQLFLYTFSSASLSLRQKAARVSIMQLSVESLLLLDTPSLALPPFPLPGQLQVHIQHCWT